MYPYQQDFLELCVSQQVLRFGTFTLKSGRQSPYFFNAGLFNTGGALAKLGRYYAMAIQNAGISFDILFGPAYKGIPLVVTTAVALAEYHQQDVPFCFNRKEVKDHGEGGNIVGTPLQGRVLLIDDVISAGTAIAESVQLIEAAGAKLAGVVIALNRQERGQGERSAIAEVEQRYGVKVVSIVTLDHLIAFLEKQSETAEILESVRRYRREYGV